MSDWNGKFSEIPESVTVSLGDIARRMRAEGRDVIMLQTGDPDFATPEPIIVAAKKALDSGLTHYSNSRGLPELREAVAGKLMRENGVSYDSDTEILITCGGINAAHAALMTLLQPGDEVLLIEPGWMSHKANALIGGARPIFVPTTAESGFKVSLRDLESARSKRTKMLVINYPNNPTGAIYNQEELNGIAEFCVRHSLWVLSDEVYERLLYDGRRHVSLASLPGMKERTITLFSFSKTFAMSGWRIGYVSGPREAVSEMLKVVQYSITNVPPFIQAGALEALTNPAVSLAVHDMMIEYARRRDWLVPQLNTIPGLSADLPEGAFYVMLDARSLGRPSKELAREILQDVGLSMVPGSGFGHAGEGFLRITFAVSQLHLDSTITRLREYFEKQS